MAVLKDMDVFTVERNPTSVMFVKRSFITKTILTHTRNFTMRVLKIMNVDFAARNMYANQVWLPTVEFTRMRNLSSVEIVAGSFL